VVEIQMCREIIVKIMPHQNPENPLGLETGHSEMGKFGWNHGTME
jgi:hypothetical protein